MQTVSLRKRLEARLAAARCHNGTLVLHHMTGSNAVALAVLLHVIDELDRTGSGTVVISNEDWVRLFRFGRTRVRHAAEALAPCGVLYVNHDIRTWEIDEARFWAAFDAALRLVMPDWPGPDGDDSGQGPVRFVQRDPDQNEQGDARNVQGEDSSTGGVGSDPVQNVHPIGSDSDSDSDRDEKTFIDLFGSFRLLFRGRLDRWLRDLLVPALQIGLDATRAVIARCRQFGGRTWKYVHVALRTELNEHRNGRQLALIPVVEVPKPPQLKNDLHMPAAEPAWLAEPEIPAPDRIDPVATPLPSPEHDAWETAYEQLRVQLDGGKFDTWVRDARFLRFEDGRFYIGVRNGFTRDMLQHRLYRNVARVLSDAWGRPATIEFEIASVGTAIAGGAAAAPSGGETLPYFRVQGVG